MNAHLPLSLLLLTLWVPFAAHADTDGDTSPAVPVSGIRLVGLVEGETLSGRAILDLEVTLSLTEDGYVATRPDAPSWSLRLRDLEAPFGARALLQGSAIEALVERIRQAHDERGTPVTVRVAPGTIDRLLEPSSDGLLMIQIAQGMANAPVGSADQESDDPAAPERRLSDAFLGTVRSLSFRVSDATLPDENALLALAVDLGWDEYAVPAGYVASRESLPTREVALWEIGGLTRTGTPLYGSAIRSLLKQVRSALIERGHAEADVWVSRQALRRLSQPRSDGLLEIEIRSGQSGRLAAGEARLPR